MKNKIKKRKKKMDKRQGFTLVELLAALVILGLLMAVAAPNVLGILTRSKSEAYIEDAKKLVTRAEYVLRSNSSITKPTSATDCVRFSLAYLDNSEFNDPPNGGAYFAYKSFVHVCKQNHEYTYQVQLLECEKGQIDGQACKNNGYKGVKYTSSTALYGDDAIKDLVVSGSAGGTNFQDFGTSGKRYCADGFNQCSGYSETAVLEDAND